MPLDPRMLAIAHKLAGIQQPPAAATKEQLLAQLLARQGLLAQQGPLSGGECRAMNPQPAAATQPRPLEPSQVPNRFIIGGRG